MKSVGSYEAKTHLPRLLSRVEKGETITITKRGKPIAVLAPVRQEPRHDVKSVIEEMLAFRDRHGPVLGEDLTVRDDRGGTALSKKKGIAKRPQEGLVLDCSIVMAWYFVDESSAYADAVARQLSDRMAFVPLNWPLEVANTLIVGERRKRSTQAQAATLLKNLASMPITIDDETNLNAWSATLSLAREQNLTAYDAAYLELAMRRGLPLATLDDKLKTAAQAVGVPLYGANDRSPP